MSGVRRSTCRAVAEPTSAAGRGQASRAITISKIAGSAALTAAALSTFLLSVGDTAPAVAMPSIGRSLGLGVSGLEWVVNAYSLALAVGLLVGGLLVDRVGYRHVFLMGIVVSSAASLLAGLSPDGATLIAARVVQGVGGALVTPAALALVASIATERRRGLAIGFWAGASAAGLAVGPLIGALLVEQESWRWVFLINAPLGVAALVAVLMVAEDRATRSPVGRVDPLGILLTGIVLFAVVFALSEGMAYGWGSPAIVGLLAAAALSGLTLVARRYGRRESGASIVARVNRTAFWGVNGVTALATSVMCSVLFFSSIFLQLAAGLSSIRTGLAFLPMTVLIFALSPIAGYASDRLGRRTVIVAGLVGLAGALTLLSRVVVNGGTVAIALGLAAVGLAVPFVTTPSTAGGFALAGASSNGRVAGALNISRAVGLSLGIALMGAMVNSTWPRSLLGPGPARQRFAESLSSALLINAGIALLTAALAAASLRAPSSFGFRALPNETSVD